jgi:RNA polymerase sigma-70 factor (ECF subfamily)
VESTATTDRDAFLDRYRQTAPAVYAYLYKTCAGERGRVEDLVQETFSAALLTWKAGKSDDVTLPWLLTVARHKMIDSYRKHDRESRHMEKAAWGRAIDDSFSRAADTETVLSCLRRLPPLQRAVVALRFVDNLPLAEVAALLGKRVGAIDSLQRRALAALRTMLEETDDDR